MEHAADPGAGDELMIVCRRCGTPVRMTGGTLVCPECGKMMRKKKKFLS